MGLFIESKSAVVPVRPDDELVLSITIGNAQGGGWALRYGPDALKAPGSTDPASPIPLGRGADALRRGSVHVNTTAFDIRPQTDDLDVTVTVRRLSDGKAIETRHQKKVEPGGSALFISVFAFVPA